MQNEEESPRLSPGLRDIHNRLCSVEALLANIYAKYYLEQYPNASIKSKQSLQRALEDQYSLYTNYNFIDDTQEYKVCALISDFFAHLDSIISMNNVKNNLLLFPNSYNGLDDPNHPQYKAKIQALIGKKLPQFGQLIVDQIYPVSSASDLVLRVWLQDPATKKPVMSLIIKTLGSNPVRNDIAHKYGLFYREASFYSSMADPIRQYTPICYFSSAEDSLLIMEDKGVAVVGDQLYGYTAEEAYDVITGIIRMHEFWMGKQPECFLPQVNDQQITDMIPQMLLHCWGITKASLNPDNNKRIDAIIEDLANNIKPIADELSVHSTIIHGDLRMENLLFRGPKLDVIVDWQLLAMGSPMVDVAYFLVQSGGKEEREQVEARVFALYSQKFAHTGLNQARLEFEYRLATKYSLIIPIMAAAADMHAFEVPRKIITSAFHRAIEAIAL